MKKFAVVLFTLIAVLAVAIPLLAQDEATPATAAGSGVNVRSGPGTEYSLRGGFTNGKLTITGRNEFDTNRVCRGVPQFDLDMWLRVDFNGVEGWVAFCAVDVEGNFSVLPVVSPSDPMLISDIDFANNPEELSLGEEPETPYVYGVTRARVNLREGGSLNAPVIEELRGGELIYVVGMSADGYWAQVKIDDKSGWIARYLLSLPYEWEKTLMKSS